MILVKGGNSFTTVDLNSYIKLQCSQGFFWLRNRLWNSMSDATLFIYRVFKFHFPSTMEHTQAIVSCSEFTTHLHLVFHLKSSHKAGFEFTQDQKYFCSFSPLWHFLISPKNYSAKPLSCMYCYFTEWCIFILVLLEWKVVFQQFQLSLFQIELKLCHHPV